MDRLISAYEAMSQNGVAVNITTTATELVEFGMYLINTATELAQQRIKAGADVVLLTPEETMSKLQVKDRSTLWRWEKRGYLTPVRSGKRCLYRSTDIEAMLNTKTH